MEKISPTRMNLLSRKSQLALAHEGAQLLKYKREVLLSQFMELVKPLMEKQKLLHKDMVKAFHCLNIARAIDGWEDLLSATLIRETKVSVNILREKKRGLEIPIVKSVDGLGADFREPYSKNVSLRIFETRDRFEGILKLILEVAPLEASLKRLAREIQKTTRRVNALEVMLIPRLRNEIRFIRSTLEEREREDNFRLRRLKNKKELGKR